VRGFVLNLRLCSWYVRTLIIYCDEIRKFYLISFVVRVVILGVIELLHLCMASDKFSYDLNCSVCRF